MFRKVCCVTLAIAALWCIGGCVVDGPEEEANAPIETQTTAVRDFDSSKDGALGLIFKMPPVDDRISVSEGDSEDWRYIIVPDAGTMNVTIHLDSPANIIGTWYIRDALGREMHSENFDRSHDTYELKDLAVSKGLYHLQIFATKGSSVYTVEATFNASAPQYETIAQNYDPPTPPPPVQDTTTGGKSGGGKSGGGSKSGGSKSGGSKSGGGSKTTNDTTTPPPPPPPPAQATKKVTGSITMVTPNADGTSAIKIGVGKSQGVETGEVGTLEGLGVKITMTQCFNTSCKATVPASVDPKQLSSSTKVVFNIKQ